jgi:hypothetical protein
MPDYADTDSFFLLGGWCCCFTVLLPLLTFIPMFIGMWRAFEKAGVPGWAALVPIYNLMVMARIADREDSAGLMCLIPIAGIYFYYLLLVDFCKKFRPRPGYEIGLLLLPMIFWPILGFGEARHIAQVRSERRADEERRRRAQERVGRRERDEEERRWDEEEDDRPRRRGSSSPKTAGSSRVDEEDEDRPRKRRRDDDDEPNDRIRKRRREEDD